MRRLGIRIALSWFFFIGSTCFAYTDNCDLVKNYDANWDLAGHFETAYKSTQWTGLLTEATLKRAIANLKHYCCFDKKDACENTGNLKEVVKDWYTRSPYLYDHLIDVMLRNLSPYPYEGLSGDAKAVEWNNIINAYATRTTWAVPNEATTQYNKYWKDQSNWSNEYPVYRISLYNWVSDSAYQQVIEWASKKWTEVQTTTEDDSKKFEKFDKWDLTTKHLNVCQIATNFSTKLWNFNSADLTIAESRCIDRVYDVLLRYIYVYSHYIEVQSNLLAYRAVDNYNNYFNSRTQSINTTITRANTYLFWVIRAVWKITSICN